MKYVFLNVSIILFIFSCSEPETIENKPSNFYGLNIGNSWVYKSYKYNHNTNEYIYSGVIDSVSVIGQEELNGELYFKIRTNTSGYQKNSFLFFSNGEKFAYRRESEGNLLNEKGDTLFTNNNFQERFISKNDFADFYEILIEGNTTINVEAGNFDCINSERYGKNSKNEKFDGRAKFYYAQGFGLISYNCTNLISNTPDLEKRLDSYYIR